MVLMKYLFENNFNFEKKRKKKSADDTKHAKSQPYVVTKWQAMCILIKTVLSRAI